MNDDLVTYIPPQRRVWVLTWFWVICAVVGFTSRVLIGPSYLIFLPMLAVFAGLFALTKWRITALGGERIARAERKRRRGNDHVPFWHWMLAYGLPWTILMSLMRSVENPSEFANEFDRVVFVYLLSALVLAAVMALFDRLFVRRQLRDGADERR